ncbi:MAG: ABC transporter permease, partial [Tannerellaceae bacterium]
YFETLPADAFLGTSQLIQSKAKDVSSLDINDFLNTVFYIRKEQRLTKLLTDIKDMEMDRQYSNSIFVPFLFKDLGSTFLSSEISFRVKANRNNAFAEQIKQGLQQDYRAGNIIVKQIESYESMQDQMHLGIQRESKNYFFGILFLLVNIVLGLLGIFWFRTQQRRCELALFMVVGASRVHIFLRLIVEGVLLLTLATLPAMALDYMIATNELTTLYQDAYLTPLRFASTVGITYLLMLVMIVVGIGIPAWRAMQIEPAEALHEEYLEK